MRFDFVKSEREHILPIAAFIRKADEDEITASNGGNVLGALAYGLRHSSLCLTLLADHDPIAMFGVAPDVDGHGVVWMLATTAFEDLEVRKVLLRRSREMLELMMRNHSRIHNVVDARNVQAIRWLKWLGFEFGEQAVDVNGYAFYPFWKVKDV